MPQRQVVIITKLCARIITNTKILFQLQKIFISWFSQELHTLKQRNLN